MKTPKLTLLDRIQEAKQKISENPEKGKQRAIYTPVAERTQPLGMPSDDVIAEVVIMLREFTENGDASLLTQAADKARVPLIPLLEFYHSALSAEADRFISAVAAVCWDILSHEERMRFIQNGSGNFADLRAALSGDVNDEE